MSGESRKHRALTVIVLIWGAVSAVALAVYLAGMVVEDKASLKLHSGEVYEWDGGSPLFLGPAEDTGTACVISDRAGRTRAVTVRAPFILGTGGKAVSTDVVDSYPARLTCDGPVDLLTGFPAWIRGDLRKYASFMFTVFVLLPIAGDLFESLIRGVFGIKSPAPAPATDAEPPADQTAA